MTKTFYSTSVMGFSEEIEYQIPSDLPIFSSLLSLKSQLASKETLEFNFKNIQVISQKSNPIHFICDFRFNYHVSFPSSVEVDFLLIKKSAHIPTGAFWYYNRYLFLGLVNLVVSFILAYLAFKVLSDILYISHRVAFQKKIKLTKTTSILDLQNESLGSRKNYSRMPPRRETRVDRDDDFDLESKHYISITPV